MAFLANDCSLHGQFETLADFHRSLSVVMRIRSIITRLGAEFFCHRSLLIAQIGPSLNMQQGIAALPRNEQRAVMAWLTKRGPFWEDERLHPGSDYLACDEDVVTDTALGEAAWRARDSGDPRALVSFAPSRFERTPIVVDHVHDDGASTPLEVENHWHPDTIEAAIERRAPPIDSWDRLEALARTRFTHLTITDDAFTPLRGHPFTPKVADRFRDLLERLDRLRACVDPDGNRTPEGRAIYQNFFESKKARFTDSSETEKAKFRSELTFRHPEDRSARIFCPWHGKMGPPYRMHFTYPVGAAEPLYVVYLGPKLTKT